MRWIEDISELEKLYGTPSVPAIHKVANRMMPQYRKWIMASRFCVVSTVGVNGTDGSPRGDDGPVVRELDEQTLAIPDWRGNNRMDTIRNIVEDGRISLMFMIPGSNNVMRINGMAKVTTDAELCQSFENKGKHPRSVIVVRISEIYSQCARAPMRARLWTSGDESAGLPTMGDILQEMTKGSEDGAVYDAEWNARAQKTIW